MANSFNDLLQDFVNKPYQELLNIANGALEVIAEGLKQVSPNNNAADLILPFLATTLAVDGKYSQLEHGFLNDVIQGDVSYEEGKACMQSYYNTEIFEFVDQMIDSCGDELKNALIIFCLCFAAVDETITREEGAYIAKLLA